MGVTALIAAIISGVSTGEEPEGESWTFAQVCDPPQMGHPTW